MSSRASKNRNKKKTVKSKNTLPSEFASKVLENTPRENGFYFYSSIGNPTGNVACSFDAFCQDLKICSQETIEFHLERGDFENWIRFLGDHELASQIEKLRSGNLPPEQLVPNFISTMERRQNLLRKSANRINPQPQEPLHRISFASTRKSGRHY